MASAKDTNFEGRIMSVSAGGKVGASNENINLEGKLGVDLVNIKSEGVQANIGFNVNTGISADSDGVEVRKF